jgi:hypothetical protein
VQIVYTITTKVPKIKQTGEKTLTFLDVDRNDLNVRALVGQPFFQLFELPAGELTVAADGGETEQSGFRVVSHADLGGGNIEALPGPGQQALDYAPFPLERSAREAQFENSGIDVHYPSVTAY